VWHGDQEKPWLLWDELAFSGVTSSTTFEKDERSLGGALSEEGRASPPNQMLPGVNLGFKVLLLPPVAPGVRHLHGDSAVHDAHSIYCKSETLEVDILPGQEGA